MMNILLINGPNLNLLGTREPEIYGNKTLSDIEKDLTKVANEKSINLECFQSNHEGKIVDKIHDCLQHNDSEVCRINLDGLYEAVNLFLGSAVSYPKST